MQFNEPIKWLRVASKGLDLPNRFVVLSHSMPPENFGFCGVRFSVSLSF